MARAPDETGIAIRPGKDEDARALKALVASCWSEYPSIVVDLDREAPSLNRVATFYRDLGGKFWIAERSGRIVGSVGAVPAAEPGGLELRALYVARDERRAGLGGRLSGLVEAEARARGAAFVDLWTDTLFRDAHRLYERLGFARGPRTRELEDLSGTVEYYYRKKL